MILDNDCGRRFRQIFVLIVATLATAGCAADPPVSALRAGEMFAARAVRIHPVFTKVLNGNGGRNPDSIEALVELNDQFGDPCKGAGTFAFELFGIRSGQPDPRGERLSTPWVAPVITVEEQKERWSRTSRCYSFKLASDALRPGGEYVLSVTYSPVAGLRLFDRIVLLAANGDDLQKPGG